MLGQHHRGTQMVKPNDQDTIQQARHNHPRRHDSTFLNRGAAPDRIPTMRLAIIAKSGERRIFACGICTDDIALAIQYATREWPASASRRCKSISLEYAFTPGEQPRDR